MLTIPKSIADNQCSRCCSMEDQGRERHQQNTSACSADTLVGVAEVICELPFLVLVHLSSAGVGRGIQRCFLSKHTVGGRHRIEERIIIGHGVGW